MPEVSIFLHAEGEPDFTTSDAIMVDAIRKAVGPHDDQLVMAREFATVLRGVGLTLWATRLERMEEPHMVRVEFSR